MTVTMHDLSVGVFARGLTSCSKFLAKASEEARTRGLGEADLLATRLAPDMFTLAGQVQTLSDIAKAAVSRLAGRPIPVFADTEASLADLKHRMDQTAAYVGEIGEGELAGAEDREVVMPMGSGSMTFSGRDYLLGFATPNFYFHLTTTYDILRHRGFQLGKRDYLGRA